MAILTGANGGNGVRLEDAAAEADVVGRLVANGDANPTLPKLTCGNPADGTGVAFAPPGPDPRLPKRFTTTSPEADEGLATTIGGVVGGCIPTDIEVPKLTRGNGVPATLADAVADEVGGCTATAGTMPILTAGNGEFGELTDGVVDIVGGFSCTGEASPRFPRFIGGNGDLLGVRLGKAIAMLTWRVVSSMREGSTMSSFASYTHTRPFVAVMTTGRECSASGPHDRANSSSAPDEKWCRPQSRERRCMTASNLPGSAMFNSTCEETASSAMAARSSAASSIADASSFVNVTASRPPQGIPSTRMVPE